MTEFIKYKNKIRGAIGQKSSRRLLNALKEIKNSAPISHFENLLDMASSSQKYSEVLVSLTRLDAPHLIKSKAYLGEASVDRELAWSICMLQTKKQEIINFLNRREKYYSLLSLGEHDQCETFLSEIFDEFGWSTWFIDNKVALLGKTKGLEAHKSFVKKFTNGFGKKFFVFYSKEVSSRNENSIEWSGFARRYISRSRKWNISEGYEKFLRFKILGLAHCELTDISAILAHEQVTSFVDLYETLVELAYVFSGLEKYQKIFSRFVSEFAQHDIRLLAPLLKTSSEQTSFEFLRKSVVVRTIESAKDSGLECQAGIFKEISKLLANVFEMKSNAIESCEMLAKLYVNWRSLPLINLAMLEVSKFYAFDNSQLLGFSLRKLKEIIGNECVLKNIHVSDSLSLIRVFAKISEDDLSEALKSACALQNSDTSYYRTLGVLSEVKIISIISGTYAAMQKAVYYGCRNENFFDFMDIPYLMAGYEYLDFTVGSATPIPAISFWLLDTIEAGDYTALHCKTAIKQLLKIVNVALPSEIPDSIIKNNLVEMVFFLRYVCTPEYLELCRTINSPKSAAQERIKICSLLSTIDQEHSSIYNAEISDLALKISTEDGLEIVESTRVYVDNQGLIEWSEKELKDIYLSYLAHVKAGIIQDPRAILTKFDAAVHRVLDSEDAPGLESGDLNADGKMRELMEDFADAFLRAPMLGLNSFLGTRVRHGSLEGYFRGRFEKRNLIFYYDKASKKYIVSDYWLKSICNGDKTLERKLGNLLSESSKGVDDLLSDAALNRIQLRNKEYPKGLIEFKSDSATSEQLVEGWAAAGKLIADYSNSFRHFSSYCIDELFWPGISFSLKKVQEYVHKELLIQLLAILQKIDDFAVEKCDPNYSGNIRREVQILREELNLVADLVSNWFQNNGAHDDNAEFRVSALCNTALQAAKYVRPSFDPKLTIKIEPDADRAINVSYGVVLDILLILFINISKWCGFENGVTQKKNYVPVTFSALVTDDDFLSINLVNDLSPEICRQQLSLKLEEKRYNISSGDYLLMSQSDNGDSGLYRIAAMLIAPSNKNPLEFGVEKDQFFVTFKISRKILFKEYVMAALETS
jgi:hypothetical protein